MKAKRILSLLLTVAMIAACGVTAFAAPTGNDDYVKTDNTAILAAWDNAQWDTNGAAPDENEIRADVVATKMTDAELEDAIGLTLDEWGVSSANRGKAYKIQVSLHNLGTLYQTTASRKKTGFGIDYFDMYFTADKDVEFFSVLTSDITNYDIYDDIDAVGDDLTNKCGQEGKTVKITWYAGSAADIYPIDDGTYENASIADAVTFVVFAEDGTTLTLDKNASVMYANFVAGAYAGADGSTPKKNTVALWHPATVTLGSAPVVEDDPVINDTVEGDKDGVAIAGSDKKYDNAYAVTASFAKAGSITGAGVLFIPKAVLGSSELTAAVAEAANAYKAGAAIGDGTLTIKAAIKDIPRALQGQDVVLVTRPYVLSGEAYTYGNAAETTINFGSTGEVE